MKEICLVETKPGVFDVKPSRTQKRKAEEKRRAAHRRREEWILFAMGVFAVIGFGAFGAWTGSL